MKNERLALRARSFHAHNASDRAVRHSRDQVAFRGEQYIRIGFTEAHARPRVWARNEPGAVNRDVAAGDAGPWLDAVYAWYAVGFQIQFSNRLQNREQLTSRVIPSEAKNPSLNAAKNQSDSSLRSE
jgi:hypothetical protein